MHTLVLVDAGKAKKVHVKHSRHLDAPAAAAADVEGAPDNNVKEAEAKKAKASVACTHNETLWIVKARLKMQALFDNKIHKNETGSAWITRHIGGKTVRKCLCR